MPKHKKKFIDKRNAVTFHLVHRSQRDPLQADQDASRRVLVPIDGSRASDMQDDARSSHTAELSEAGIFYDDGYDYLQHLRSRDELNKVGPGIECFRIEAKGAARTVRLPVEVLPSQEEENIGLLNKAHTITGPQPDWDPDIVEALEGELDMDDPDNILDDDFVIKANGTCEGEEGGVLRAGPETADARKRAWIDEHLLESLPSAEDEDGEWEDVDDDENGSDDESCSDDESEDTETGEGNAKRTGSDARHDDPYMQEETRSHFTNYSMSSSIIRRTKGLMLLDERFEQLYEAQYEEADVGALDHEDIDGRMPATSTTLQRILEEFEESQQARRGIDVIDSQRKDVDSSGEISEDEEETSDEEEDEIKADDDNEQLVRVALEVPVEKWDCESILSTYSSLYNHPKVIEEPRRGPKGRVLKSRRPLAKNPTDGTPSEAAKADVIDDDSDEGDNTVASTQRHQGETADERRARKQMVKLDRKKRREEKKATKVAFKTEQLRQEKEIINVRRNLQGVKIV